MQHMSATLSSARHQVRSTHYHAIARLAVLLLCTFVYLLTSSFEVVMIKSIYEIAGTPLPIYCAFLLNVYVLIELPLYGLLLVVDRFERQHKWEHEYDEIIDEGGHSALVPCTRATCVARHSDEPVPRARPPHRLSRTAQYIAIGGCSTGIVFLKMFGLGKMAGSLYVMITNCSVVFNYLLIRVFIPSRHLNHFHQLAAILTLGGVILITISNHISMESTNLLEGTVAALAACFLSSLLSVLSETVFKSVHDDKPQHQTHQGLFGLFEVTLANATLPLVLILVFLPFLPEYHVIHTVWYQLKTQHGQTSFVTMSIALASSKLSDRFSKFELIHVEGSFFFTVMDTVSTALTAAFSFWFMGESLTWLFIWGCIILTIAGFVNGYAAYHEHATHPSRKGRKRTKSMQQPKDHQQEQEEDHQQETEHQHHQQHSDVSTELTVNEHDQLLPHNQSKKTQPYYGSIQHPTLTTT